MVSEERWQIFNDRREQIETEKQRLRDTWIRPANQDLQNLNAVLKSPLVKEVTAHDLLKRPEIHYQDLVDSAGVAAHENPSVSNQVEILIKYSGYIDRQTDEIKKLKNNERIKIPNNLNYSLITGLSNEVRQKLIDHKPETLAQAARISGVTPAAVSLLLVHIKKIDSIHLAS